MLFDFNNKDGGILGTTGLGGYIRNIRQNKTDQKGYDLLINTLTNNPNLSIRDIDLDHEDNFTNGMSSKAIENIRNIGATAETSSEQVALLKTQMVDMGKTGGKVTGVFKNLGTTLLNGLASFGISMAITGIITGLEYLFTAAERRAEEIKKEAEAAVEEYDSATKRLQEGKDDFGKLSKEYSELSKGVNALGQNVSLTTAEYDRYHEVANSIADITPSLVKAWDDQGNAILKVKDDVEALSNAYNQEVIDANNALIAKGSEVVENSKNQLKDAGLDGGDLIDVQKYIDDLKSVTELTEVTAQDVEVFNRKHEDMNGTLIDDFSSFQGMLLAAGLDAEKLEGIDWDDGSTVAKFFNEMSDADRTALDAYISKMQAGLSDGLADRKKLLKAYLQNELVDTDLSSQIQDAIIAYGDVVDNSILQGLDTDIKIGEYAQSIIEKFNSLSASDRNQINEYINISTLWNNDELSYDEYIQKIQAFIDLLNKLFPDDEEIIKSFKILFDIPDEDELANKQDVFVNRLGEEKLKSKGKPTQRAQTTEEISGGGIPSNVPVITYTSQEQTASTAGMPSDVVKKMKSQGNEVADAWYDSLTKSQRAFVDDISDEDLAEAVNFTTTEQFDEWLEKIQAEAEIDVEIKSSDAVDSMADAKAAITSLNDLYQQTVKMVASDGQATGFADPALLNNVEASFSKFADTFKKEGNDQAANEINGALERFEDTLVRFPNDADKAQDAMDDLITTYIDQTDIIKNLTEENAEWSIKQLEAMGITNAEDVVMTRLNKGVKKTTEAIKNLSKAMEDYNNATGDSKAIAEQQEAAIKNMVKYVQDALAVYDDEGNVIGGFEVSEGFVKSHMEDIQAMAEGDVEALSRVRLAAAKGAVMEVTTNVPTDVAEHQIQGLMDMAAQLDAMEIEPGATLDDSDFINKLNEMVRSGAVTVDQVNAMFESMGYEVKWTTAKSRVRLLKGGHVTSVPNEAAKYLGLSDTTVNWEWTTDEVEFPQLDIVTKKGGSGAKAHYGGSGSSGSSGGSGGSGGGSDSSSDDEASENSEETFDWIEVYINRIEEEIARLDKVIDDVYTNWATRNDKVAKKIGKLTEEIDAQKKAAAEYEKYTENIKINDGETINADDYENGTSDVQYIYDKDKYDKAVAAWATGEYQNKIKNGQMSDDDIEKIENEYLVNAINEFTEYWNKHVAANDMVIDLEIQVKDSYKQLFENVLTEYEDQLTNLEKEADIINERITRTEEHGYFVDESYYNALIENEKSQRDKLGKELEESVKQFNDSVSNGKIQEGTEAWNEMYQQVQDVNKAYEESNTELVKLNNTIMQLQWDKFDWLEERLSDIANEADWLIGLLQSENNYDDKGFLNNRGFAQAGLISAQYTDATERLKRYQKQYAIVSNQLANDPNNKNIIEEQEKIAQAMRDTANAEKEAMEAMQSLVREGISKYIESLGELIDKFKESLSTEKDLYDFQKNIANQTKSISDLEKQLAAYQGDDSEETRKKRQELQNQLNDAQQQLQETEWDRYISETNKMLDDMKSGVEEYLNDQTESIIAVMNNMQPYIQKNGEAITKGLQEVKNDYDIKSTEHFESLGDKIGNVGSIIEDFRKSMEKVTDPATNGVKGIVEHMSVDVKTIADGMIALTNSENNKTKSGNGDNNTPKTPDTSGDKTSGVSIKDDVHEIFYKGSWQKDDKGDWYQYGNGSYAKNEYVDGYWLNSEGYWDSSWDGSWKHNDKGYWWEYSDGSFPKNEWLKIDGDWYYFDSEGYMVTGKQTIGGKSYTFGSNGDWLGYAKGTKGSPRDQLAWTQENASELIYRTSDGAMLTPLNRGDMVFTHDMSQRLWEIAKGNIPTTVGLAVPNVGSSNVRNVTSNNNITIELPNVENYDDFKREMKQDKELEKFWQEITIGQAMGNNTLKKNRY